MRTLQVVPSFAIFNHCPLRPRAKRSAINTSASFPPHPGDYFLSSTACLVPTSYRCFRSLGANAAKVTAKISTQKRINPRGLNGIILRSVRNIYCLWNMNTCYFSHCKSADIQLRVKALIVIIPSSVKEFKLLDMHKRWTVSSQSMNSLNNTLITDARCR